VNWPVLFVNTVQLAGDEVVLGVGEVRRSPDAGVEDSDAVGVVPAVAPGEPHAPTKATKATIHVEDSLIATTVTPRSSPRVRPQTGWLGPDD
jgi:hypothetical protein